MQQPSKQVPPRLAKPRPLGPTRSADVSEIVRDIKGLEIEFQAALEAKEPWAPEVESQRQTIRTRNITLLFSYPLQVPAARLEILWTTTTYSVITIYRKKLTAIQESLGPHPQHQQSSNRGGRGHPRGGHSRGAGPGANGTGPVELRRVLQKFKQFLGREKEFWQGICGRLVRTFGLQEGRSYMAKLGVQIADGVEGGEIAGGMTAEQRMEKMGMLQKSMIFLGDLERYKEMYTRLEKDRQGSNRNSPADIKRYEKAELAYRLASSMLPDTGNPFNQLAILPPNASDPLAATYFYLRATSVLHPFVTSRKNLENTLRRPLNVWKAARATAAEKNGGQAGGENVVEVARDEGGLKSQIVVLLAGFISKSTSPLPLAPKILIAFRPLLLSRSLSYPTILRTLVSSIAILSDLRRSRPSSRQDPNVTKERAVIQDAVLSFVLSLIEVLMEVAMLEIRETLVPAAGKVNGNGAQKEEGKETKSCLNVWEGQIIPCAKDGSNLTRLSPHLTPTLRRILPVLRVASRWLENHFQYLTQTSATQTPSSSSSAPSHGAITSKIHALYSSYSSFSNLLLDTYPPTELKQLGVPLEEDVELKGFQPLRRKGSHSPSAEVVDGMRDEEGEELKDDHPNEFELMRIWSLIDDAWRFTKIEKSGLRLESGRFVPAVLSPALNPSTARLTSAEATVERNPPSSTLPSAHPVQLSTAFIKQASPIESAPSNNAEHHQPIPLDHDDTSSSTSGIDNDLLDSVSVSTDDPVNRAMRAALEDGESVSAGTEEEVDVDQEGEGDDGEEEQILWRPTTNDAQQQTVPSSTTPIPSRLLPPSSYTATATSTPPPASPLPISNSANFTAHDLLRQMSSSRPSPSSSASYLTAPQQSSSPSSAHDATLRASPSPQRRPSASPNPNSHLLFGPGVRTRSTSGQLDVRSGSIWGPGPASGGASGGAIDGQGMDSSPFHRGRELSGGFASPGPTTSATNHLFPQPIATHNFPASPLFSSLANNLNSADPSSPFRDQSLTPIQHNHNLLHLPHPHLHQSNLSPGPRHLNPNPLAQNGGHTVRGHALGSPFGFPQQELQQHERFTTSYDSIVSQQIQHFHQEQSHLRGFSAPQQEHLGQPSDWPQQQQPSLARHYDPFSHQQQQQQERYQGSTNPWS